MLTETKGSGWPGPLVGYGNESGREDKQEAIDMLVLLCVLNQVVVTQVSLCYNLLIIHLCFGYLSLNVIIYFNLQ